MKTAMILAAGRGERLRPLTDLRPKALCTVHKIPLIEYHVVNLASAGFERIVINHAYLGGQIRQHLGDGARWNIEICYSPEPPGALETGGGIVNALSLLGNQPFVTVNADIFTDYDFSSLKIPLTSLAHVVLVNKPTYFQHSDFGLTQSDLLDNANRKYIFSGINCYRPELFNHRLQGRYSVIPLLRQVTENKQVTGEVYQGRWIDIGSPERLEFANKIV